MEVLTTFWFFGQCLCWWLFVWYLFCFDLGLDCCSVGLFGLRHSVLVVCLLGCCFVFSCWGFFVFDFDVGVLGIVCFAGALV